MEYKGYKAKIFFDPVCEVFYGYICNLKKDVISFEGVSINELKNNFKKAVKGYLEGCKALGIKPEILKTKKRKTWI